MSTLTTHWSSNVAAVWKSHWGDSLVITTRNDTLTATGVVATVSSDQMDEEGFHLISHDAVVMFLASDITIGIEAGTCIVHSPGAKDITYEVVSDGGFPAWEYDDPQRTKMRVRVKRIKESDAL